jgi:hypothetical protein
MDETFLRKLLSYRKEEDWFDFKQKMNLYQSDGKVNEKQRDELIKDILGMVNGNTHIIRKTKYLIVGVANDEFDEKGMRILHAVNYTVPTPGDINKWVNNACDHAVTGIECETILVDDVNLFIITLPSTFDVHETIRELNASSHFNKHTVFMRQNENTVPASF